MLQCRRQGYQDFAGCLEHTSMIWGQIQFSSIQFYLYNVYYNAHHNVSRHFTVTQSMTPEQISLTKAIILNLNQRKMAGKKNNFHRRRKKSFKPNSGKEKL